MAVTTPTNVDTAIPEVWASEELRRRKVGGFWGRFTGKEGSGAPIIQKSELLNKPGDLIHIQVTDPLSGAGVSGDTATLVGNEENLVTSMITAAPLFYRHAVRNNRRANKKNITDLKEEAKLRLGEWLETKMDMVRFGNFAAAALPAPLGSETYTPNDYGPNTHVTKNTIVLADTLTVVNLQAIKLKLTNALAKPILVDGFPHYILVTHPNTTFQLKQEARYETWVQQAAVKGDTNPFFRGALAVVDGMIVYEHPNVDRSANGSAVQVSTGCAFGAEAFVEALDENVSTAEMDFDYGLEHGYSISVAFQPRRALELSSLRVFHSSPTV